MLNLDVRSDFRYQTSLNPKRCLTKPSEIEGEGHDNREAGLPAKESKLSLTDDV